MSTGALETQIGLITASFLDFFGVVVSHFLPFLIGIGILVTVWLVVRRIIQSFR